MKKVPILKEELYHYLNEEWNDSLRTYKNGLWLTTRAFQLKLRERGIILTWPTLSIKLNDLFREESVDKINTSAGEIWKPLENI
jgi:hypothetical protein